MAEETRREWSAQVSLLKARLELEPDNAVAWEKLGALSAEVGHWEDACRAYRRAVRLDEESYPHWEGLFISALASQRLDLAERAADELKRRFPMRADSHLATGHIHKAHGRISEAMEAYQRALDLEPASSGALFNLVEMSTPLPTDALGVRVLDLAKCANLDDLDFVNILHACGRIHEKGGDVRSAFAAFQNANAASLRITSSAGRDYDPRAVEQHVERTMAAFPSPPAKSAAHEENGDVRIIFIVGMPRSGTTLVEQILGNHARVSAGGELPTASECERIYQRRRQERGLLGPVDQSSAIEREINADVREMYLDRLLERDLDSEFVTDKLPGNFLRLGFIRLIFPDAILLHCRRDPMATCWSLFTSNFATTEPQYHSLTHLAHYYACYNQLMSYWGRTLVPPPITVSYEALVAAPERQIRELIAAVGLDWDDQCMAFYQNRRPVLTASHRQVRTPMYTQSVDRWRKFSAYIDPLMVLVPADQVTSSSPHSSE